MTPNQLHKKRFKLQEGSNEIRLQENARYYKNEFGNRLTLERGWVEELRYTLQQTILSKQNIDFTKKTDR